MKAFSVIGASLVIVFNIGNAFQTGAQMKRFGIKPTSNPSRLSLRTKLWALPPCTSMQDLLHSSLSLASDIAESSSEVSALRNRSVYTVLALYLLSFPGLWSTVKRSTVAKVKRKTYVSPGAATENGKNMTQQAAEIMAYMKANNYEVAEAGETITFRGVVARSASQAFFLTFCTAIGIASLALVLQVQFQNLSIPGIGTPNWFYLTLLSPYAGIYYWRSGDRVDDIKVKLSSNDDDTQNEITVEGNDEEIDRMWRALELNEKGMLKVDGILA